jgi:16S rRNA (cytosine967-C5)-methyltransferase
VLAVENTGQIGHFLEQHRDAMEVPIEARWGRGCRPGRQVLPGEDEMDGFYFACVHKRS